MTVSISDRLLEPIRTAAVQFAKSNYRVCALPAEVLKGPVGTAELLLRAARLQALRDLVMLEHHPVGVPVADLAAVLKALADQGGPKTEAEAVEGFVATAISALVA